MVLVLNTLFRVSSLSGTGLEFSPPSPPNMVTVLVEGTFLMKTFYLFKNLFENDRNSFTK